MVDHPGEGRAHRLECDFQGAGPRTVAALCDQLDLCELDRMTIRDLTRHLPEHDDTCLPRMLALMFAATGQGSLCLRLDRSGLAAMLPNADEPMAGALVTEFAARMDKGDYDCLVDRIGGKGFKPLVVDEANGRRLLYFQKFHYHEQRLKKRLQAFLARPIEPDLSPETIRRVIDGLYTEQAVIRKGPGGNPIVRDPFQVAAIRAALTIPLLIVSGGPGTGKTSLLVNLLRALVRTGSDPSRIMLAAPTGRAAQRITEALTTSLDTIADPDESDRNLSAFNGVTLHKLLVYRSRDNGFLYNQRHPLPADVVVVDEVSMVDVVMMDHLFQAVDPAHTRVILIGDKNQLPSVAAGSVLADLNPESGSAFIDHFMELQRVYRSAGALRELAQTINAGRPVALKPVDFNTALTLEAGHWAFVAAADGDGMNWNIDQWTDDHYVRARPGHDHGYVELVHQLDRLVDRPENESNAMRTGLLDELFAIAGHCRILTVLRHGRRGAGWINTRIGAGLRRRLDPGSLPDSPLFSGALIMMTRNDYARGLYNGDVGVVLRQPGGGYHVYFKRSGTMAAFLVSGVSDWELAFAMTVHKSQGSEFDDTLLILPDDPNHRLLTREIIYTAATRAARRLIVYGTAAAFQTALKRKIMRQSGLLA